MALFKSNLQNILDFKLITQDSLISPLSVNSQGDLINLCYQDWSADRISYGEGPDNEVSAPKAGQSVCLKVYPSQQYYYYLDCTPTLGAENDSSGAYGYIEGIVTDSSGTPQTGVEIKYGFIYFSLNSTIRKSVFSDSSGYFIFKNLAHREGLYYNVGEDEDRYFGVVQIWPEDTVSIHIVTKNLSTIHHNHFVAEVRSFELKQNYPNPFNSYTIIEYNIPAAAEVELSIFNVNGRLVEHLVGQEQPAGTHQVEWQAQSYASGIYFYQLKTGKNMITKKLLLIR
jgi:hypothetical protein